MTALGWIRCSAISLLKFVVGQMGFEVDASWHAPVLQLPAVTPFHVKRWVPGYLQHTSHASEVRTPATSLLCVSRDGSSGHKRIAGLFCLA